MCSGRGMENPWGGGQYGGTSAHLEHSVAGKGQEASQDEGDECPAKNTDLAPGHKELLRVVLSSVSEKAPSGAGGLPLFLSSHTVKTFPYACTLISHLFVCLLIILLLEQNMQWMMRLYFCEKPGLCSTTEQGDQPRAHEEGTRKEPPGAAPTGPGSGTVWKVQGPDSIREGLSFGRFKRKHLKAKEGKGAPDKLPLLSWAPPRVGLSRSPGSSPHCSSRPPPSLQRACSIASHPVRCSLLRSWFIRTEPERAGAGLPNTNPRICSA